MQAVLARGIPNFFMAEMDTSTSDLFDASAFEFREGGFDRPRRARLRPGPPGGCLRVEIPARGVDRGGELTHDDMHRINDYAGSGRLSGRRRG